MSPCQPGGPGARLHILIRDLYSWQLPGMTSCALFLFFLFSLSLIALIIKNNPSPFSLSPSFSPSLPSFSNLCLWGCTCWALSWPSSWACPTSGCSCGSRIRLSHHRIAAGWDRCVPSSEASALCSSSPVSLNHTQRSGVKVHCLQSLFVA